MKPTNTTEELLNQQRWAEGKALMLKQQETNAAIVKAIRDWGYKGKFHLQLDSHRYDTREGTFKTPHTYGCYYVYLQYLKANTPTVDFSSGGDLDEWLKDKGDYLEALILAIAKITPNYVSITGKDLIKGVVPNPEILKLCSQALGLAR